jgi:hypothetical protein
MAMLKEHGQDVAGDVHRDGHAPLHRVEHSLDVAGDRHMHGHAPLHRACWGHEPRHAEVVRYQEADVDANLKTQSGKTCIETTRNPATIKVLRELGGVEDDEQKKMPIEADTASVVWTLYWRVCALAG